MIALQWGMAGIAVLTALWSVWLLVRDEPTDDVILYAAGLLEAGTLVQLVWGIVRSFDAPGFVDVPAYVGYLVGTVVLLPIAFFWSAAERNRAGTGVMLVAMLVLPVLLLRLHHLWIGF